MNIREQINPNNIAVSQAINTTGIEKHKKTAALLIEAATHHLEAARHHETGNNERALQSTITAQRYHSLAIEEQRQVVREYRMES